MGKLAMSTRLCFSSLQVPLNALTDAISNLQAGGCAAKGKQQLKTRPAQVARLLIRIPFSLPIIAPVKRDNHAVQQNFRF